MTKFDPRMLTDPERFLTYLKTLNHFVSGYTKDDTNSIGSVNYVVRKRSRL